MKPLAAILLLITSISAHYNFPALIGPSGRTSDWQYMRQWTNYYAYGPVENVNSLSIRCNVDGATASAPGILDVPAGSNIAFTTNPNIYHPGPSLVYMARVPQGKTASNWDGSGSVWFKIYEERPSGLGQRLVWPSDGVTSVNFTIPASTPSGNYLLRTEHIGLHVAQSEGAAQFYISCGQINVINGGSGTPSPLVAFPGAYSPNDNGILVNLNWPIPTSYTPPGPQVWHG